MRLPARSSTPARWPFWVLLAAWVCANSPQVAVYTALTWLGEARHFTHQQRLTMEVAHVLGGAKLPGLLASMKCAPDRPFAPVVPVEATLKKIELAVERTSEAMPPEVRVQVSLARSSVCPPARREAPPHEPPRGLMVV